MILGEDSIASNPSDKWCRMLEAHDVNLRVVEARDMPQLAEWFNDS